MFFRPWPARIPRVLVEFLDCSCSLSFTVSIRFPFRLASVSSRMSVPSHAASTWRSPTVNPLTHTCRPFFVYQSSIICGRALLVGMFVFSIKSRKKFPYNFGAIIRAPRLVSFCLWLWAGGQWRRGCPWVVFSKLRGWIRHRVGHTFENAQSFP